MHPLSVTDVCKRFDEKQALNHVSFSLAPGEIFGLIGLNGAGKTTLIKIVLDLLRADQGNISLFGYASDDVRARQRLSYLPEKFQPSRYLKGIEYLSLSVSYYGRRLARAQAESTVAQLDLDPAALDARVGTYSKGMGQKLGLAGALLVDAPLLILDEPMSGLDPKARIRLKEALLTARAGGKTVFFSSHILSDIDEICDRTAVLHDGVLRFLGTPQALRVQFGETALEKAFLRLIEAEPLAGMAAA